jgi:hypothetical protein
MKFIRFNDWLEKINEESKEERARRELEASRRGDAFDQYIDKKEERKNKEKAAGFSGIPKTDEEMKRYMKFLQSQPIEDSPAEEYETDVYHNVETKTNFTLYDFPNTDKGEADSHRILDLIHDCFDDGSTEEEATNMVIDLLRKMKYIK